MVRLIFIVAVFAFVLACDKSQSPIIPDTNTDSLLLYLAFDNGAVDSSIYRNQAEVFGAVPFEDRNSNSGGCYAFNGVDDVIQFSGTNFPQLSKSLTVAAWVYADTVKSQSLVRKGPEVNGSNTSPFGIGLSAAGFVDFMIAGNDTTYRLTEYGYPTKTWFSIVGTYDGEIMKLYVNGVLKDSTLTSIALNRNSSPLLIGSRLRLESETLKGRIDDIRVCAGLLSESEILTLYK